MLAFFYPDRLQKGDQRKPAWRNTEDPCYWDMEDRSAEATQQQTSNHTTARTLASQEQSVNVASQTQSCAHSVQAVTLVEMMGLH